MVGGAAALLAVLVGVLSWDEAPPDRPALSTVPVGLWEHVAAWPPPEEALPPSTPLAPLLVADQPDALAVMTPREGATSVRRGQSLTVRFNRPMVEGWRVGRPASPTPLTFRPALRGEARWVSRSTVVFAPAPSSWTPGVREVRLGFVDGLTSLGGEPLVDDLERVLVLDGAPRVSPYRSQGRVAAGAPLPLYFDAPVQPGSLRQELLAYEIGGGHRSVPITLTAARQQPEDGYRVDVRLRRALEPGARIGLALAPRYLPWGGSSPAVMSYELAPRPHIEGVGCQEGAAYLGQCDHRGSPGEIVSIGPSLRLLSSARLAGASVANFRVRPAVRDLRVRLAPHGPPQHRLVELSGEWEPDQVYEVRVSGLRTEEGEAVRPLPPLAVRSAGHAPQIRVASGRLTYERDAAGLLPFATIHPAPSDVLQRRVEPGQELAALVSPLRFVRDGGASTPLAGLAPDARANRWGAGRYPWRDEDPTPGGLMSVVSFRPDPSRLPNAAQTAFVQATDLGVTVRAHPRELLVWVTSIHSAQPVAGAEVLVADAEGRERGRATTDREGVAHLPLSASPLVVSHALLVQRGDDRAAILLDPRRAVGPSSMGLSPGAAPPEGPIATVFTDRGAYRPGESLRAKVVLRSVEGTRVSAVSGGQHVVRVFDPEREAPFREITIQPSRFGTAAVELELPVAATLGSWRVEVLSDEVVSGSASFRVAEFRQPTFRVDLSQIEGPVHAGDALTVDAAGTYLFGAPVTNGRLRWSLVRAGGASYPERWSRFGFTPAGVGAGSGTVAGGEVELEGTGRVPLEMTVQLAATTRTRFELEAEITDAAGHAHATRRSFVGYPAALEVGLARGDDWVALGEPLEARAVLVDHDGAPVSGRSIEARFFREGWHSWWEWSERSHADGSYQLRRDQRRAPVHRCRLESAEEPTACAHAPSRPGTYLIEVEAVDDDGRRSVASRRVYVAGPDEQPDRDPPGAPIAVTPTRLRWGVGETAELAFESPFPEGMALITLETANGARALERRPVTAGGNVIRVPLTSEMVPNVFVGVTLVRPRTGPPGETIDLHAPDLRFGVAELRVVPQASRLQVTVEAPDTARPGDVVPVAVQVRDERGRPVRGEVTLWAVDEGTLRLTGYQTPSPVGNLFRPRPPAFAWEDTRRDLVSRVQPPPLPEASGDGGQGDATRRLLDDRERFEPTPLWAPALETDAQGRVSATVTLPTRATEYRVMAVAVDAGARAGRASAQLVAEQPLVIRPAFSRFLTAGDRVEAAAFLHNATEAPLEVSWRLTVGESRREAHRVTLPAGGELRVAESLVTPEEGPLALRFDAEADGEAVAVRDEIGVAPRGRYVRSQVFGAAEGARDVQVGLPESTPRTGGGLRVTVASHPFIGFEGAVDSLEASPWSDTESIAATLIALAAWADLGVAAPSRDLAPAEIRARAERLVRQLRQRQNADGGFARWTSAGWTIPHESAVATHALVAARRHGWVAEAEPERAVEALIPLVNGASFHDAYGEGGLDRLAYALRVLAEAGQPQGGRATAIYEQRERLSPFGTAQLALALGDDDPRTDTLVLAASRQVLADRDDEARDPSQLRWVERSARTFGAVLEAASRFEVGHDRAGELAGHLLVVRGGRPGHPWTSSLETARALLGLAAYARRWAWVDGEAPSVSLDGQALPAITRSAASASYRVDVAQLRGAHTLRVTGGDEGAVFFSLDGRWAVPLTEADETPRGRRTAIHRVFETQDGRPIEDGATVPLGALIRVRLFVYTEGAGPDVAGIFDPLPAGFEAVDADLETTPRASLAALLGMGPDDDVVDARAHHAMRSLGHLAHRAFTSEGASFYFDQAPAGLQEYTYAVRASSVGEFTVPPAQIEALYDRGFVARSQVHVLRVVDGDE